MFYELWRWNVVEQLMSCLQIVWKVYDFKWCMSMWKHGHDDYMARTYRAWCKTKTRTRTWNTELRPFGWESHRHHETKTVWVRFPSASCVRPVGLKSLQHQAIRPFGWESHRHYDMMKTYESMHSTMMVFEMFYYWFSC
jgi:hypothetical protein